MFVTHVKSRMLPALLVIALVLANTALPAYGSPEIRVTVDGAPLLMDVSPVVVAGRTLVPVRAVFEALDSTVTWDQATNRITGIRGNRVVVLSIGSTTAQIDGVPVALDVAPVAIRGRAMVPARFVAESLGATVTWNENTRTVEITLPIPVATVGLSMSAISLVTTDAPLQLVATIRPHDASDQRLIWRSSDSSVAIVSSTGLVTPVAPGVARITVSSVDGGKKAVCDVTVVLPYVGVTGILLSHNRIELFTGAGETFALRAIVAPTNATNQNVNWISTNPEIATVTSEGLVSAIGVGSANIIATSTDGGRRASCVVTVNFAPEVSSRDIEELKSKIILDNDLSIFTLFAFMNFTGYDDENNRRGFHPVRAAIRNDLHQMNLQLKDNRYLANKGVPYHLYRHYLTYTDGAPNFRLTKQLPAFLSQLTGLGEHLAAFYIAADVETLFNEYDVYYRKELERYSNDMYLHIARTVRFLRIPLAGISPFYFNVNLQDAYWRGYGLGTIYSHKGAGILLVGPSDELNILNVVHEFLHGVVTPSNIRLRKEIEGLARMMNHVPPGTQAAGQAYNTWFSVFDESLIRALSSRFLAGSKGMVQSAMGQGFILTEYFDEQFDQFDSFSGTFEDFIRLLIQDLQRRP
ncbi:MAG: Ig-like domain-containing protein [Dethiobacter sp.]|nr:Ig-like domain-containing protein [Dethiobacter sp.]MBS4053820.1 Ig-like domain-containing protein [Thermaerobacter sp.]